MSNKKNSKCDEKRQISGGIWCDDHADIYIGDCHNINKLKQEQNHPDVANFKTSSRCCDYLYFICWSNDKGDNGFLAELRGDNTVLSGDNSGWEVFATGIDFDTRNNRPKKTQVEEQIQKAHCEGWKPVFVGAKNNDSPGSLDNVPNSSGISQNANFIWYNSGNDSRNQYPTSPYVPFAGFNHNEFLIFRVPVKSLFIKKCHDCECEECKCNCDCGCSGCNDNAKKQNQDLMDKAMSKFNHDSDPSKSTCNDPSLNECKNSAVDNRLNFEPCFYFHWGDGTNDQIEEHDTEVFYLTVCNKYNDIKYNGLRITKVTLVPTVDDDKIQIVPDTLISIDCLEPCSCQAREFAMITRSNNTSGQYTLEVEYCFESISLEGISTSGKAKFPVTITED